MRQQIEIGRSAAPRRRLDERRTVVVADDGVSASIAVLGEAHPASVGSVFEHAGREWQIRGRRRHSRVIMATPVETPRH
jgi:hypothetical protein